MQGESERATAGGVHGLAQTCSARTTLCDVGVPDPIFRPHDPAGVRDSGTRDAGVPDPIFRPHDPAGVRDIPLIPLNPGESRFKKSVSPASRARQAATGVSNPR